MLDYLKQPLHEDEQLYFIHVPKCAGTSFISLVDERYVIDEIIPTHYDIKKLKNEITDEQLAGYRFIRGHLPYDLVVPRLPRQPRIITFLREPITRLISNFQMRQRVSDPLVGLQSTLNNISLEEFLNQPDLVRIFANRATRLIGGMKKLSTGERVPNLELAKERLSDFDFVGIVEHFNDSLELFCHIFDFPPVHSQRNLNISPNREARSEIAAQVLERIAEVEQADIELYKLGVQLFEKQYSQMQKELAAGIEKNAVERSNRLGAMRIDFGRVDPGSGWHVGERSPKYGVVRWSGPETVSYLRPLLAPGQSYEIRFRVLRAVARDVLESLRLEVNGHNIPLKKHAAGLWGGAILDGSIPKDILIGDSPAEFAFIVNRTASMSQIPDSLRRFRRMILRMQSQEPDSRLGGLLYNWLEITADKK
jgi:hypothetical protein